MKHALLLTIVLLTATNTWAVNKCKGPDGKISFQDAPCADGTGEKLNIRERAPSRTTTDLESTQQGQIASLRAQNEISAAIREGRPVIGMTVKQLNESMGLATKVNTHSLNGEMREQAIFERDNGTWYVYTKNGLVDYIQHRPDSPRHQLATERRLPCPSSLEIQNARTAATSISLNESQRNEALHRVKEMERCR